MPKRFLQKYIPRPEKLRENKALKILGSKVYEPDLWHMNRKSIAKACWNGLFWAAIPMPLQMLAAALLAIPLRANIPLSIAMVWITNPITMPFVFYFNYLIGSLFVGDDSNRDFHLSVEWIWAKIEHIWLPLYTGSVIVGMVVGLLSYIAVLVLWRMHVIKRWKNRKQNRKKKS
ncbi:DUF2062 domain-containing protein [Marinomonas mediterranea]|uniref:DUF2062 domain-containing protein n=1 Tax=Marinomonas mediterranea TaxID=119864 RepID=UPI002349C5ED|nr:DUF2062 domain-containing protein [Marinomonas mediterranea]WCN13294.1 DUF2062 domain-containing protein [Marinomonas mediterranea]